MNIEIRSLADIKPYEKNPRINDDAVQAVARSIREFGFRQPIVVDGDGVKHNWREDLGRKLLGEQHEEGYWINEEPSWNGDNPVVVTAFAAEAIENILKD